MKLSLTFVLSSTWLHLCASLSSKRQGGFYPTACAAACLTDKQSYLILLLKTLLSAADPTLETWVKQETPMIATPPPNMGLVGWRDPYIFETKAKENGQHEWGMLLGSGLKGKGGAVMIYRSQNLRSGSKMLPNCT